MGSPSRLAVPSRRYLRELYNSGQLSDRKLSYFFNKWSRRKEWLLYRKHDIRSNISEYTAGMLTKRGNKPYAYKVRKRFNVFWRYKDFDKVHFDRNLVAKKQAFTRILFLTYTYRRDISLRDAWTGDRVEKIIQSGENKGKKYYAHEKSCECVSCSWNRQITKLKKRHGEMAVIRCWETQRDGFPHIHALIVFESAKFEVFRWKKKYRIQEKELMEWDNGFSDVQAMPSIRQGMKYVSKYMVKSNVEYSSIAGKKMEGCKAKRNKARMSFNLAIQWLYDKRSFSISGNFHKVYRAYLDSITTLSNSNSLNSDIAEKGEFVDIVNKNGIEWFALGVWEGDSSSIGHPFAGMKMKLSLEEVKSLIYSTSFRLLKTSYEESFDKQVKRSRLGYYSRMLKHGLISKQQYYDGIDRWMKSQGISADDIEYI